MTRRPSARALAARLAGESEPLESHRHPRFMADKTGDGRADIVGFGNAGVYVYRL